MERIYTCPIYVEQSFDFEKGNDVFLEVLVTGTEEEIFGNIRNRFILANSDDIVTIREMLQMSLDYHRTRLNNPSRRFLSEIRNSFFFIRELYEQIRKITRN